MPGIRSRNARCCRRSHIACARWSHAWIAEDGIDGVLTTGGTGFTGRDSTPEALLPLLDKQMPGFGELFRAVMLRRDRTSNLQSRAFAGLANGTFVFALPGSTSACRHRMGQDHPRQLDARTRPWQSRHAAPALEGSLTRTRRHHEDRRPCH
jgi:molybdenum cofactor biosynthesis protein B